MNDEKSIKRQKTEGRRQKSEVRSQKTEGRRQKAEDKSLFSVLCPLSSVLCPLFSVLCPLFSVLCALMLAGCAEQQRYETIEQICVPGVDKAEAMQIAEDVLAEMHFTIEKADLKTGIIRTRPLPGAQFFEFWRSDNVGVFNAAEANLHSIRRIAQICIRQKTEDRRRKTEDGRQKTEDRCLSSVGCPLSSALCPLPSDLCPQSCALCISCDVQVQRLSVPKFEPPRRTKFEIAALSGMEWVDLGKDAKLATEILKRIENRFTAENAESTKKTKRE